MVKNFNNNFTGLGFASTLGQDCGCFPRCIEQRAVCETRRNALTVWQESGEPARHLSVRNGVAQKRDHFRGVNQMTAQVTDLTDGPK